MSQLQLDVFNDTRVDAFDWIRKNVDLGRQAQDVLWAIATSKNGLTDQEGTEIVGIKEDSWRARRHDIIRKFPCALVSDNVRLGMSGFNNRVWRLNK